MRSSQDREVRFRCEVKPETQPAVGHQARPRPTNLYGHMRLGQDHEPERACETRPRFP